MQKHKEDRRIRIWSAGCSSGEEAYSIAITFLERMADAQAWDIKILATALSDRMLQVAKSGSYDLQRFWQTSPDLFDKYFKREAKTTPIQYRIKDGPKRMVDFARLNLMSPWPMRGKFDVIFCRNTMIYFDKPTQAALIQRFWQQLDPGGLLLVGHSESLTGIKHEFRYIEPTVYEKPE